MRGLRSFPAAGVRRSLLPALAAVALALTACGGGGSDPGPVATATVDLPKSYRFAPQAIAVPVGTTVTWTNNDDFTHNVNLEGADPLTMSPGESATRTFTAPGMYPYVCSLHPNDMTGSVLVS
jgi:plastocyanin